MHDSKKYDRKFSRGLVRDHAKHRLFKGAVRKYSHVAAPVLPGVVDLRAKVAPCEDQGQCGSCWDFSLTNALRSAVMLASGDPGALSKNYLLYNVGPVKEYGCGGGDFDASRNFEQGAGPCLESLSPYEGSDSGQYPANAPVAATALSVQMIGDGSNRPTAQQLCEALFNGGAFGCLSVDVAADDMWSSYNSGIYSENTSQSIDHMVRIVGYNAETSVDAQGNAVFNADGSFKNGDGYFTVRNNWNTSWGEEGDMRSRYAANNLAETALLFVVQQPAPPPPPPVPPQPPVPPAPVPPVPAPFSLPILAWVGIGAAGALILGAIVLIVIDKLKKK